MPFKSKAQRAAMFAAAEGKSSIGIPPAVGQKFVADAAAGQPLKLKESLPGHAEGTPGTALHLHLHFPSLDKRI